MLENSLTPENHSATQQAEKQLYCGTADQNVFSLPVYVQHQAAAISEQSRTQKTNMNQNLYEIDSN